MSDLSSTAAGGDGGTATDLPLVRVPFIPRASTLWSRALVIGVIAYGLVLLDQLSYVFLDYWLLDSLGFADVFSTNFWTGFVLFLIGIGGVGSGVIIPAMSTKMGPGWRRLIVTAGVLAGMFGGYFMSIQFLDFLLLLNGGTFGETEPVFGRDIGFYAFTLPALWVIWTAVFLSTFAGLISSISCASLSTADDGGNRGEHRLFAWLARVSTPMTLVPLTVLGITLAVAPWLMRYSLLFLNNEDSMIWAGAEYIDIVGFFSTINYYYVSSLVLLGATFVIVRMLSGMRKARGASAATEWPRLVRTGAMGMLALIVVDFSFRVVVEIRDVIAVRPNEPVIQLSYIKRHIDRTITGWDLDKLEIVEFVPADVDDPLPDPEALAQQISIKNVALWPGWVSYLEQVVDPPYADRILLTDGDPMIYGPVLEIFRQQQQLRTYYDFLDIDTVRYNIDGEPKMMVSAVRELPMDVQPWLYRWAQHALLFTHGLGLVIAPSGDMTVDGEPVYLSSGVPTRAIYPELEVENQAIYYGEGGGRFRTGQRTMAFSNAVNINELDYATNQATAEVDFPDDADWGVQMDSLLKRLVVGWRQGSVVDVLFSSLLGNETRVHYFRTPLERVERVAPFLYLDTNPYAFADNGGITWLINAMTTTHNYPYSIRKEIGDKSEERLFYNRDTRTTNYIRDTVKVTLDAYTGKLKFYQIADEPIISTWARIYPSLFTSGDDMPQNVREHRQYPQQMFHTQFDDIYKRYHMRDPLTFFNVEDLWDDADEVVGPVLDEGAGITFSMEPYFWVAETGTGVLPATENPKQFALSMQFANEKANNLRAIPVAYQDGPDYGRLVILQVPKGLFYPGVEQADAAIDQDTGISQSINWWNRLGAEVLAGHTTPLVIGDDVVYVSVIMSRSTQNTYPQIKRVVVVFRGHAADGATMAEALQKAIGRAALEQQKHRALMAATGG